MLVELTCLAIDTVITSACYYGYRKCVQLQEIVQETSVSETKLDTSLYSLLAKSPDALPYICISGQVRTCGCDEGLVSQYKEGIVGVLQKLVTKEHKTQRVHGYWTDFHRVVRDSLNVIPFCITRGDVQVRVSEPLESRFLRDNLTVTHDVYQPKTGSMFVERIFGDVSKGLRDTEKMLKIGTSVLGFGRLVLDSGALVLEKPEKSSHYIITSLSKPELLSALRDDVTFFKVLTGIFACTGVFISYLCFKRLTRHWLPDTNTGDDDDRFFGPIRDARRRRSEVQPNQPDECVVCVSRPREIVLLNCGHICLCADCAEEMFHNRHQRNTNLCPICRGRVERILPIYMA